MAQIYNDPNISYQLALMRKKRLEAEEDSARKKQQLADIGSSAWKSYQTEQALRTKEFMSGGNYQMSPEYLEKNFISRQFTPTGGRIDLTPEAIKAGVVDTTGAQTMGEQFKNLTGGMGDKLTAGLNKAKAGYGKISDIANKPLVPGKEVTQRAFGETTTHMGDPGLGGTTFGQVAAGVGAGISAWDLATNWDKKSGVDKGLGVLKTGLSGASMVPGPHQAITAPLTLGIGLLDMIWD